MRGFFPFYISIAAVFFVTVAWPGDAPFINDEPALFLAAHAANQEGRLAQRGLYGTVGLAYGPMPTWFYQGLLSMSTTPEVWVVCRVLVTFALLFTGLWLMARALSLWRWFIPIVLISPYMWYYSRLLWDNSFLLPVSAVAFGAYAWFLARQTRAALLGAITAAVLMPFIHFMSISFSLVLLCHALIFFRRAVWSLRYSLVGLGTLVLVLHWSYINLLVQDIPLFKPHSRNTGGLSMAYWIFPFESGRFLSGAGLAYFFGDGWLPETITFSALRKISLLGYLFVWAGMIMGTSLFLKKMLLPFVRNRSLFNIDKIPVRTHCSAIALLSFILFAGICLVSRSRIHPHYYNGIWIVSVFFAWLAVDRLVSIKAGLALVCLHGVSLAGVLLVVVSLVHERGGTRSLGYGSTIGDQRVIAETMGPRPRTDVRGDVPNLVKSSSILALQILTQKHSEKYVNGPLFVTFANEDPRSGRVRVLRLRQPDE